MIEILVEEIYSFKGIPVKLGSFHSKLFLLFFTFLSSYTRRSSPPVYHHWSPTLLLLLLPLSLLIFHPLFFSFSSFDFSKKTSAGLPDPWCLKIFSVWNHHTHKDWEEYNVNTAILPDILQLFTAPCWKEAFFCISDCPLKNLQIYIFH